MVVIEVDDEEEEDGGFYEEVLMVVVVLWRGFVVVVVLEKVKEKVETLVELLELWWFEWRWRKKKMKVWRSCSGCCGGGDEGRVGGG